MPTYMYTPTHLRVLLTALSLLWPWAGLLLGIPILLNVRRHAWETTLGWVTLAIYLAFVAFCCIFNAVYNGYPETDFSGW